MAAPASTGTIDFGSTFSSSNASVAEVLSGALRINGAGTTTITATTSTTTGGCVATATVIVNAASPGAPTIGIATAGDAQATVNFTPPASDGGSAITYTVTSNPGGITSTGSSAPIIVTGLTNGTAYTFTMTATNVGGTSTASAASNSVTPLAVPTASAKSVSTAYNTSASIDLSGSITGVGITGVTIGTAPAHGTVSVSGQTVTYTPSPSYHGGSDSFTYTATNASGTSAPAAVTITVGAPAVPVVPVVAAKSVSTAYNTAASIDLSGSITGIGITGVAIGTAPAHGTVSVSGQTVMYTPSPSYYGGGDAFTYTAANAGGTSAPATVTVTVGAPAVPVVAAKTVTTPYNTAAAIDLSGSITGAGITGVTIGTAPAHGTVSVSGQTVTYTPSPSYYGGSDSFTYIVANPGGTSTPATVTVNVTPLSVPTVQALDVSTTLDTPVLIAATAMATGPQPLVGASVASAPTHGTASAEGEQITYMPAAGFVGTDRFTYRVANHFGSSTPATITVQVAAAGRAGSATGTRTVTTTPGTAVAVDLAQIVPGAYVSSVLTGLAPGNAGNVALGQPTGLTFAPAAGFHGLAQISVVLVTASGQQVTINVLVLVSSQPDPSKNPDVLGLVNAQTEQAQRFAQSQLHNIDGRLESLHDGGGAALFSSTLSISVDGQALRPNGAQTVAGQAGAGHGALEDPAGATARPGMGAAGGEPFGMAQPQPSTGTMSTPAAGRGPAGLGLWVAGTANFGTFKAYRQAAGFDSDNVAVNVGVDQRIGSRALFGFSLGYNHDNADIANDGTRSIANGYSAALYGSYQPTAQTYVDLVLGGGGLSFTSHRHDPDGGSFLSGRRNGSQWFGSLTAGYEHRGQEGLLWSPYLRLEQTLSTLNGFSEQGAATAALSYGSQMVRTSLAVLGLRASEQLTLGWGTLVPRARLEVGHDFQGTSDATLSYAFIPSAGSWSVLTNPYAANGTSVQLGLGLDLQLPRNLRLTTDYEYLTQPHAHNQMIRLGLDKQF